MQQDRPDDREGFQFDETTEPAPRKQIRRKSSIFDDPVVRKMAFAAVGILILFLVTVVSALVTGVIQPGGPRTALERDISVTGAAVRAGTTDTSVWARHISALILDGQLGRAENILATAKASLDDSATADIVLSEARLLRAQGQYEEALEVADAARAQIREHHEKQLAEGGVIANAARLAGYHDNYYIALIVKADIYRDMEQWERVLEQYNDFIESNPGAADILTARGNVKFEMGDRTGAEADYREALRFYPDYEEALAGLERIGSSQ